MKRTLLLSLSLLMIFAIGWTFNTVRTEGGKPEKIARKFLSHLEKGEFEKAKKYSTFKTKEELDKLADNGATPKFRKVIIKSSNVREEEATVYYAFEEDEEVKSLSLKREGRQWLVEATKMELNDYGGSDDLDFSGLGGDDDDDEEEEAIANFDTSPYDTPEKVAKGFLEAFEQGDKIKAKALSSEDTRTNIDFVMLMNEPKYREVTIISAEHTSTSASVKYQLSDTDEAKFLPLLMVDGEWRANPSKEQMQDEDEEEEEGVIKNN